MAMKIMILLNSANGVMANLGEMAWLMASQLINGGVNISNVMAWLAKAFTGVSA
jgi:hypothetical protein